MKQQRRNTLQIEGKNINLSNFLTALTPNDNNSEFTAKINISNYESLGGLIFSLIGVCQTALYTLYENEKYDESEKEKFFGASTNSVIDVLEIAKNLLPFSEFELLKILQNHTPKITENEND